VHIVLIKTLYDEEVGIFVVYGGVKRVDTREMGIVFLGIVGIVSRTSVSKARSGRRVRNLREWIVALRTYHSRGRTHIRVAVKITIIPIRYLVRIFLLIIALHLR
jgi:hypothetical protein